MLIVIAPQECIHVTAKLNIDAVLVDDDSVNDQTDVTLVQLLFTQQIAEDFQHRFGVTVGTDDRVSRIRCHCDLIFKSVDPVGCFLNQSIVHFHNHILVALGTCQVASLLTHQNLQGFFFVLDQLCQFLRSIYAVLHGTRLVADLCFQAFQHHLGGFAQPCHISLQLSVENVHANVMRCTACFSSCVIGAADISIGKVGTASGEHGRSAVTAEEVTGVVVLVFLLPTVM